MREDETDHHVSGATRYCPVCRETVTDPMDRQTLRVGIRVGLVFLALIALVMLATLLSPSARW